MEVWPVPLYSNSATAPISVGPMAAETRRGIGAGFLRRTGKQLDGTKDLVILKGITWRRTLICPGTNTRRLTVRAAAYVVEESQERE
jgi:hypothetical protein